MEYIICAWVLVLAYFHIKLTERVQALENEKNPEQNTTAAAKYQKGNP